IILCRFYLIGRGTIGVWNDFGFIFSIFRKYIYVERNFAIGNIDNKVSQLRLIPLECELKPLKSFNKRRVAIFVRRGRIGTFVRCAIDGLAELDRLSGLPGVVWHCCK